MRPRLALLIALFISSVALAGCIDTKGSETTTAETTPHPTTGDGTMIATTSATTVSYQDCSYYLVVERASEDDLSRVNQTLTYHELPPERQREFEMGLQNGSTKLGTDLPSTWDGPRIVRYRGDRYYTVAHVC